MSEQEPHPQALHNHENAILPEEKIRYALSDSDKPKPWGSLSRPETGRNYATR